MGKPSLDLPKIFGIHLFLSGMACFDFDAFHVTGLYEPGIWVSDLYGLTGKVQSVSPALGTEGFDPFISGGIVSHHIIAGTQGILAAYSILVSLCLNVYTKDYVWAILKLYFLVVSLFFLQLLLLLELCGMVSNYPIELFGPTHCQ